MRNIKFRGKRTYGNHDWVVGYLVSGGLFGGNENACWIFYDKHFVEVIPETVGMCSTIWDQHTNDIYEGDVIKVAGRLLKVVFDAGCFLSLWGNNRYRLNQWGSEGVEIQGNIHDNPEFLNPTSGQAGINYMKDPNVKSEGEANGDAAQPAEANAQESASQDTAMEATQEEGTEG